jgi:hypothetical protein
LLHTGISEVLTENIRFLDWKIKFYCVIIIIIIIIICILIIKTISLLYVSTCIGYLQVFILNVRSSVLFILQYCYRIVVLIIFVCILLVFVDGDIFGIYVPVYCYFDLFVVFLYLRFV